MSRAITYEEFVGFFDKVIQQIRAIGKVPFPKADEVAPMLGIDSVPEWSNDLRISVAVSVPSDYPLGNPTLDLMAGIEPVSPLAQEISSNVETFMPLEFPVPMRKERTSRGPVVALPHNKVPELPMLNLVPFRKEQTKKSLDGKDLENLLVAFKESGMSVREVKSLPSGATRITFDEFFGAGHERQPEFVRVGGRR